MRQKDKPWIALGMSRATWYRRGKPTEPRVKVKRVDEVAAQVGAPSVRTYQRIMRVLQSPLGSFLASGDLKPGQADKMLADPESLERFLSARTNERSIFAT